jgi:cellobiose-specific phosphotransferase system component IIA
MVREDWSDAYFGEAVSHFEQQYFHEAKKCVKKAIKCFKKDHADS